MARPKRIEGISLGISERLVEERKKVFASRLQCAKKCGLNDNTMKGWEEGREIPSSAIEKLSCAGLDTGYILTGRRSAPPASAPSPLLESAAVEQLAMAKKLIASGEDIIALQKVRIAELEREIEALKEQNASLGRRASAG